MECYSAKKSDRSRRISVWDTLHMRNSEILLLSFTYSKQCLFIQARLIVVREPDGTLREANKDERHRMNQLYFPVKGRSLYHPRMFQPENLKVNHASFLKTNHLNVLLKYLS